MEHADRIEIAKKIRARILGSVNKFILSEEKYIPLYEAMVKHTPSLDPKDAEDALVIEFFEMMLSGMKIGSANRKMGAGFELYESPGQRVRERILDHVNRYLPPEEKINKACEDMLTGGGATNLQQAESKMVFIFFDIVGDTLGKLTKST